jgi:hypothetical protein
MTSATTWFRSVAELIATYQYEGRGSSGSAYRAMVLSGAEPFVFSQGLVVGSRPE